MPRNNTGFTLIELMIVITIISVIASIAIPSYRESLRRADRSEAKTILLETAQWLERKYASDNCYTDAPSGVCTSTTAPTLPFLQSPKTGTAKYTITVATPSASTYTLSATPTGSMVGDTCTTFTLTQDGTRAFNPASTTLYSQCWAK